MLDDTGLMDHNVCKCVARQVASTLTFTARCLDGEETYHPVDTCFGDFISPLQSSNFSLPLEK